MAGEFEYTEQEWAASTGHRPLSECPSEKLLLLHRHWMWANLQRIEFDRNLGKDDVAEPGPLMMVSRSMGFMLVWYGMLWSVIEAIRDRHIHLRGRFAADVDQMSELLRLCRNAVMHVPKTNELLDKRIERLVSVSDSPITLRRLHGGFGRLFREEVLRRTAEIAGKPPPP
jgi:hypothetical protein